MFYWTVDVNQLSTPAKHTAFLLPRPTLISSAVFDILYPSMLSLRFLLCYLRHSLQFKYVNKKNLRMLRPSQSDVLNALRVDRDVFKKQKETKSQDLSEKTYFSLLLAPNNLKGYSCPPLSRLAVGKHRRLTRPIVVSPSCTAWASRAQSAPQLMVNPRTVLFLVKKDLVMGV